MRRVAVLAVVVALVASCAGHQGGLRLPLVEGPLREPSSHGSLVEGRPVGARITDGFEHLALYGDLDATILDVRSIGGEEALEFLGAYVAGPERRYAAWVQLEGFPPTKPALGPIVPAVGAVIKPRHETRGKPGIGYELLLGYEVLDDSRIAARTLVEVDYRVGAMLYTWRSPAALVYCPEHLVDGDVCVDFVD